MMFVSEAAQGEVASEKKRKPLTEERRLRRNAKRRELYARNPERTLSANKKWRTENPERQKECVRKWSTENPERVRAAHTLNSRRRRSTVEGRVRALVSGALSREREKRGDNTTTYKELYDSLCPFPTHCPLTGDKLSYSGSADGKRLPNAASIDQIIPGKGYGNGNARIIAWRINNALGAATSEELRIAYEDRLRTEQLILQSANDLGPAL